MTADELACQTRQSSFQMLCVTPDTTVGEAIKEFNRRNSPQIVIVDPSTATRELRGVFDVNDPEAFVEMLNRQFPGDKPVARVEGKE